MGSNTDIANQALGHLGIGKEIGILDTEKSAEARAVRRFFDDARDRTLRDVSWPFATRFELLALIEKDPTDEWNFSYRYPTTAWFFRRILSGNRNDNRDSLVAHKIVSDNKGKLIFTDKEDACAEFTVKITDPEKFDPDFKLALSWLIAHYIAPTLTAGDPFNQAQRAQSNYFVEITRAAASAANEEQPDQDPQSEFIRARNGEFLDRNRDPQSGSTPIFP